MSETSRQQTQTQTGAETSGDTETETETETESGSETENSDEKEATTEAESNSGPTLLDQANPTAIQRLEQSHNEPIKCALCGEGFSNRAGAKNHVTLKEDARHRERTGDEPGVLDFGDDIKERIQVPSDQSQTGTLNTEIDLAELFPESQLDADSDPDSEVTTEADSAVETTRERIVELERAEGSKEERGRERERAGRDTETITRRNRSYTGPAIRASDDAGPTQTFDERPVINPERIQRAAIADPDSDAWLRFVSISDYESSYEKPYFDPIWLKLQLADGARIKALAEEFNVTDKTIYGHIAKHNLDTVAIRKQPIQDVWKEEDLDRPLRLTPAGLDVSEQSADSKPEQPEREGGADGGSGSGSGSDPALSEVEPIGLNAASPSEPSGGSTVESKENRQFVTTSLSDTAIFEILQSDAPEGVRRELFNQLLTSRERE